MSPLVIRPSTADDAVAINAIANWYIENTAVNFDTAAWSLEERTKWVHSFNLAGEPWHQLVAVRDGELVGFACNTRFRPKAAYGSTTETTVYIANEMHSRGYGGQLYTALFGLIEKEDFHRALGIITLPNPASVTLHEKLGFRQVGLFDEVGMKFGQYHTVAIFQKDL